MSIILSPVEARILGALMEKEMTTPDLYPLSANALKNACNQKSSRSPVVQYDEALIEKELVALRNRELAYVVSSSGSRVRKYEQRLTSKLFLNAAENAVICLLILRGPQTIGELRNRSDRMHSFQSLSEVNQALEDLMAEDRRPMTLVRQLERGTGQKEPRFAHLLCGEPEVEVIDFQETPSAEIIAPQSTSPDNSLEERLTALEAKLEALEARVNHFFAQFD